MLSRAKLVLGQYCGGGGVRWLARRCLHHAWVSCVVGEWNFRRWMDGLVLLDTPRSVFYYSVDLVAITYLDWIPKGIDSFAV
jgi:hypothetical protein